MKIPRLVTGMIVAILVSIGVSTTYLSAQSDSIRGNSPARNSSTSLHVKFEESAQIVLSGNTFVSQSGTDVSGLNQLTDAVKVNKTRLFHTEANEIAQERRSLESLKKTKLPDLNSYYYLTLRKGQDIDAVVKELQSLPFVSEAYAAPLAVSPPASPDFTGLQTYYDAAPDGMNIASSVHYPGTTGSNVKIADIEYSWNTAHEDLSDIRIAGTLIPNGTPRDPFNDNDHGTGVAGVLSGDKNAFGVTGVVRDSRLHLVNASNTERGWDVANAVSKASQALVAGDVILIEQQTNGPNNRYVPVEWVPAIYDAIKIATTKGIHVVEAAGNGADDLDGAAFGSQFPSGKSDSGAIIVGSGRACAGQTKLERRPTSTYGSRVNLQSYGECVATAGYGRIYSIDGPNAFYTDGFNGTSSAAALVAGAVAATSSAYEAHTGTNISPINLRSLLVQTGSPQNTSVVAGHIGPMPDVFAAIRSFAGDPYIDTTPPSVPVNVSAAGISESEIQLNWSASSDDKGVMGYEIYRDGILQAVVSGTTYIDSGLLASTSYTYTVQATDQAGNVSGQSDSTTSSTWSADTTAPVVTIVMPSNGSVIGPNVPIEVAASDDRGVTKIELYIDGKLVSTKLNSTSLVYSWNSKKVSKGNHTILAKSYDLAGNVGQASVIVTKP